VETAGLGHHRVLRDLAVIAQAVEFLATDVPPLAACPCGGHAKGTCADYLEQSLFDRDARWDEWWSRPTAVSGAGSLPPS
jgi:hypothetical protein